MTSSNGNIFRVTGPLCGNSPVPVNSPHKGQWRGALMLSLICVWINGWVNNREAGDLRRYRGHYGSLWRHCNERGRKAETHQHENQESINESASGRCINEIATVYPKKYAHGFVVLCFLVVTQSFIINSHEVFINIHQGCFAGTGAIVRLPQCQWSKRDGYGKISQCITTTKHSKAKTVCIFLGIYCRLDDRDRSREKVDKRDKTREIRREGK